MTEVMERGAGVALWRQISERLRAEILAGREPGDRLPAEADLAERFGVNRHTLRRAMAELAAEGLVRVDQGRGTFVDGSKLSYPITRRTRFSEIVSAHGHAAGGKVIAHRQVAVDAEIAGLLTITVGDPVTRIETQSAVDGTPISTAIHFVPAGRFPRAAEVYAETGSFTKMLKAHGVTDYLRQSTKVTARPGDALELGRLNLVPGATVLCTEGIDVDSDGQPVQVVRTSFAAERVELVIGEG